MTAESAAGHSTPLCSSHKWTFPPHTPDWLRYNWYITWCKCKVHNLMIRHIDTHRYCKMIATMRLANTFITSHNYLILLLCWEHLRLTLWRVCNTVLLTVVTMLSIRAPELTRSWKLAPFVEHLPTPIPPASKPPFFCFYEFRCFRFHI